MNRLEDVLMCINKYINYILNDNILVVRCSYYKCLQELYKVLLDTCNKIERIYYRYVLYPKLCQL